MQRLFVFALASFGISMIAIAQPPVQQRWPRVSFDEVLRREDANKDGKVTVQTWIAT